MATDGSTSSLYSKGQIPMFKILNLFTLQGKLEMSTHMFSLYNENYWYLKKKISLSLKEIYRQYDYETYISQNLWRIFVRQASKSKHWATCRSQNGERVKQFLCSTGRYYLIFLHFSNFKSSVSSFTAQFKIVPHNC